MRSAVAVLALAACASPAVQAPDGERHAVRVEIPPPSASVAIREHPAPARRIATSGTHACLVTAKGRVQCWGENREGELGRGTESWGEPRPAWVVGVDDAVEIAAGSGSTCVIHRTGNVSCWGEVADARAPRAVSGVTRAKSIAVEGANACAVVGEGDVVCWGPKVGPRTVDGLGDAVTVRASTRRTCALLASGDVKCWAPNTAPAKIEGLTGVNEIVLGSGLLARQRDGHVFYLGGRRSPGVLEPQPEVDLGGELALHGDRACQLDGDGRLGCLVRRGTPLGKSERIAGLDPALQIASNNGHLCALHADDRASCWGENANGQLGRGDAIGIHAKPVVSHAGATSVRAVYSGACALDAAGTVICWGGGDSTKTPVEDAPKAERLLESTDFGGMCALPKDPTKDVVCWKLHPPRKAVPVVGLRGATDQARHAGQSAVWVYAIVKGALHAWRTTDDPRKPEMRAIAAAPNLVRVATDSRAVCVLDKNGKATCAKAIDPFATDAKHSWIPVEASTKLREMTVSGGAHVCALEDNGAVSCSQDHELPADKVRLVPQKEFSPASHLARGYNLCAQGRDDVLRCATGLDARGTGQGDQVHVMSDFGAWKDVAGVASTSTFVCFWTKSGEVRCAGSNDEKQLGIEDVARSQEPRAVALER